MSALSDYLKQKMLQCILSNKPYVPPKKVYIALFGKSTSLSNLERGKLIGELNPSTTGYARIEVDFDVLTDDAFNLNEIRFPTATRKYNVIYTAIMDSGTHGQGNVLFLGQIQQVTIIKKQCFLFKEGDFNVSLDKREPQEVAV